MKLSKIPKDKECILSHIPDDLELRFTEMNFIEGQIISKITQTPFRGPMIYLIDKIKVAIRYQDAERIKCNELVDAQG